MGLHDKHRTMIELDITKDFLDAYRLNVGTAARFQNAPVGFRSLSTWLGEGMPTRVVFEATGAYHRSFERAFSGKLPLVKVNPLQARRFAQACGTRVKTDEVDARMLAGFGNALALEPGQPIDGKQFEIKELFSSRGALIKDRTRSIDRLKAQTLALVKRLTKARITAMAVSAFAPPMEIFRRGRDFAAWVGLVPKQHSTGGKQKLGRTSKMGQRDIRRLLVIGAMSVVKVAVHKGAPEGSWLQRMLARKPRMVVAIALANKMAPRLWAMLVKHEDYRDPAIA